MKVTFKQTTSGYKIEVEHDKKGDMGFQKIEHFKLHRCGSHWVLTGAYIAAPIFVTQNLGKVGAFFFGKFNVWPYWEFLPQPVSYTFQTT